MDVIIERPKRKVKLICTLFGILLIGAILFWGLTCSDLFIPQIAEYEASEVYIGSISRSITFEGKVDVKERKVIRTKAQGLVEQIYITEGSKISKGQVLATLDTSHYNSQVLVYQNQLALLQYEKEQLAIKQERKALDFAHTIDLKKAELQIAEKELHESSTLVEYGGISMKDLEGLENQIHNEKEYIRFMEKDYAYELKELHSQEDIINEKIRFLKENIKNCERIIQNRNIIAEEEAIVLEEKIQQGQLVQENDVCFVTRKSDEYLLKVKLQEKLVNKLSVGVLFKARFGDKGFDVKLKQISPIIIKDSGYGNYMEGIVEFSNKKPENVVPNMEFVAEWSLEEYTGIVLLERGPFLSDSNSEYVFRIQEEGKIAEKVAIEAGLYDEKSVQILSGLSPGDQVIISSYKEFLNSRRIRLK